MKNGLQLELNGRWVFDGTVQLGVIDHRLSPKPRSHVISLVKRLSEAGGSGEVERQLQYWAAKL